jgi:hypothetical protein
MNGQSIAVAAALLVAGTALATSAQATTSSKSILGNPAQACQLSLPTTDTKVRPRATGYLNEGTQNNYVICAFSNPSSADGGLTGIAIGFRSMDGLNHSITCTFVNGLATYSGPQVYVTRTMLVTASPAPLPLEIAPADFGGTTTIPGSAAMSVTCNLPPNIGIVYLQSLYQLDIGS